MMKSASLASFILAAYATADDNVTGDLDVWDDIFASRDYHVLADAKANGLIWTEGPVLVANNDDGDEMLYFSDVIAAKTYSLDVDKAIRDRTKDEANNSDATTRNILDTYLHVIKERSGDAPQKDDNWRAEPGGNGLAVLSKTPRKLVMCQHGAQRRVVILDVDSGTTHALASEYKGKKFNGPNDIELRSEKNGELFAYFTDPVYAWLEKDRFEDLPHLDEQVKSHGPGLCGVYRVKLTEDAHLQTNVKNEVELIASDMMRPNDNCKSGTSRWRIFEQQDQESTSSSSWAHSKIIENTVSADAAEGGCADGFALYEYVNREERRMAHVSVVCALSTWNRVKLFPECGQQESKEDAKSATLLLGKSMHSLQAVVVF
eukprot:scaffold4873_cov83-Skeletonema_dohrnii-CCMP3373.AAC.3